MIEELLPGFGNKFGTHWRRVVLEARSDICHHRGNLRVVQHGFLWDHDVVVKLAVNGERAGVPFENNRSEAICGTADIGRLGERREDHRQACASGLMAGDTDRHVNALTHRHLRRIGDRCN